MMSTSVARYLTWSFSRIKCTSCNSRPQTQSWSHRKFSSSRTALKESESESTTNTPANANPPEKPQKSARERFTELMMQGEDVFRSEEFWKNVQFVVFDAPTKKAPFEERMEFLRKLDLPPHVKIAEVTKCEGEEHLKRTLREVVKKGGDGLILRKPGSYYQAGRSPNLLKIDAFNDDEARVVGYILPKAKPKS